MPGAPRRRAADSPPDNLKAAVIKPDRHEPTLNAALRDMGKHYRFTVLPCDPGEPTQKALVEDAVRITYNRIAARLRGREFHSLQELNKAVGELNTKLNQTRMQKRPYTREERFHAMEKPLLQPLPGEIFEMRYYADLKVGATTSWSCGTIRSPTSTVLLTPTSAGWPG